MTRPRGIPRSVGWAIFAHHSCNARSISPALTLTRQVCPRCNTRAGLGTPVHPKRPTYDQKHRTSLFAFDRRERQRTSDARFRSDASGNGCALTRRRPLNGSDPGVTSGPSSELAAATFNEPRQTKRHRPGGPQRPRPGKRAAWCEAGRWAELPTLHPPSRRARQVRAMAPLHARTAP